MTAVGSPRVLNIIFRPGRSLGCILLVLLGELILEYATMHSETIANILFCLVLAVGSML